MSWRTNRIVAHFDVFDSQTSLAALNFHTHGGLLPRTHRCRFRAITDSPERPADQLRRVLGQALVSGIVMVKQVLDDMERVLDVRTDLRLVFRDNLTTFRRSERPRELTAFPVTSATKTEWVKRDCAAFIHEFYRR
jgi:hypothetical protein